MTEKDGDQFKINAAGVTFARPKNKNGFKYGAPSGGKADAKYLACAGVERAYYGRGLVQLTWWYNYASAGVLLGLGLDLLFNPERMLEFDVSYAILIAGMIDGKSFAGGQSCAKYFTDAMTDYTNARYIVNGGELNPKNKAGLLRVAEIAALAQKFEALLMNAKQV